MISVQPSKARLSLLTLIYLGRTKKRTSKKEESRTALC